jgi:hypothetical protein
LIVVCDWTKISLLFREDCTIFCEGEWSPSKRKINDDGIDDVLVVDWQLVGCCIIGRNDFIGHNGLVSFIGLGLVGFIGLGLVSLVGFFDRISLVGPIGFIGLIGLGDLSITSLVGSSASSARRLIGLISFVIAAKTISRRLKQAAALGVATLRSSATEIIDVAFYYFASSSLHVYSLVREKMLWWLALARKKMWRWIASFGESDNNDMLQDCFAAAIPAAAARTNGVAMASSATKITNAAIWYFCTAHYWFVREGLLWHVPRLDSNPSYHGDALQYAKQLFYISLPQMTKYCVMRECENILHGFLYVFDLVFAHKKEFSIFKFPKRFLEISSGDLTSSLFLTL